MSACGEDPVCPGEQADLTWLVHRAGQRLRAGLDGAARCKGLAGGRDWIVLTAVAETPGRTQLALAQELGLDKTTMTALLDRLERDGLLVRRQDPHDRRARLPEITDAGREVQEQVAQGRDRAEAEATAGFTGTEREVLRDLLTRLAAGADRPGGSCM